MVRMLLGLLSVDTLKAGLAVNYCYQLSTRTPLYFVVFRFFKTFILPYTMCIEKGCWHDEIQKPNTNCHPISWTSGKLPEFTQFKCIVSTPTVFRLQTTTLVDLHTTQRVCVYLVGIDCTNS